MNKDDRQMDIFSTIKGLKKVDPAKIVDFQKTMEDSVIPSIVENDEARQVLAAGVLATVLK